MFKKRSFFEKLTGGVRLDEDADSVHDDFGESYDEPEESGIPEEIEDDTEAQLTVDVYNTPSEIVIETMVAGVRPEDLEIDISRDMISIRGTREEDKTISGEQYFVSELYWGAFSRTITLPEEIEPEEAEAIEKHGLLRIKLPKIDKHRQRKLRVKTLS